MFGENILPKLQSLLSRQNMHSFCCPLPTSPRKITFVLSPWRMQSLHIQQGREVEKRTYKLAGTNVMLWGCILLFCASNHYMLYFGVLHNAVQSKITVFVLYLKRVHMHQYSWVIHGGFGLVFLIWWAFLKQYKASARPCFVSE